MSCGSIFLNRDKKNDTEQRDIPRIFVPLPTLRNYITHLTNLLL